MPRYFFHLRDGESLCDPEGLLLDGPEAAEQFAIRSARDLMAGEIMYGKLSLRQRIEVTDDQGSAILTVNFRDAIALDL